MDGIALFRAASGDARELLEATMADVTPEAGQWRPPGSVMPIAAQYAHVIYAMDATVHSLLQGKPALADSTWLGRTGLSELPPIRVLAPFNEWAAKAEIDLTALRGYAQAVYAEVDRVLGSLQDEDLQRKVDLNGAGLGEQTALFVLTAGVLANVHLHCGEISCLKGLQGQRGYPV